MVQVRVMVAYAGLPNALLPHMCCAQYPTRTHTHLGRHLRCLVGLGVQPAQRLQVSQVVVLRQCGRQVDLGREGSVTSMLGQQACYHGEWESP